jgi:hypothetical protein
MMLILIINCCNHIHCFNQLSSIRLLFAARKLEPEELPHSIYVKNYSTAAPTCIVLRKWVFSPQQEARLCQDDVALGFIFWQV